MTTAFQDPRPIADALQQPEIDKASLNDVLEDCGWELQAVNWIFEQVTGNSLVATIITPITGDWSKIRADGDAWRNVGTAMNDMSYNLTANVATLRDSWDGEAAKAHERYIALGWKAGLFAEMGVAHLIAKGFDTVAEGAEALGKQAARLLDYLVKKLVQAAATVWVPVAGWLKAAEMVWNAYQIYQRVMDIIETIKKLITDVKALFDAVGNIASALGKLKDADSLAEAMNATQEVAEGVRDVRNSVNDIKDGVQSVKDSATEIGERGRDIGSSVRDFKTPTGAGDSTAPSAVTQQGGPAVSAPPPVNGGPDATPGTPGTTPGGPVHTPPTTNNGDSTHASTAGPTAPSTHPTQSTTPSPAPTHTTPPPVSHTPVPSHPTPTPRPSDSTSASSAAPAQAPAPSTHPTPSHTPAPAAADPAPATRESDNTTRMSGSLHDDAPPAPKVHDDVPGVKYHESDGGGIQHRGEDGKPIPLRGIEHPDAGLVEKRDIAIAQTDASRQVNIDKPGLPRDHPEVQRIVPESYDPNGGKSHEDWQKDYVKTPAQDGKPPAYHWPDPEKHPEGFASPEARKPVVLEPGSQIDRFGKADGRFLSPVDTSYPERGLPPSNLDDGYHRYVVEKPIPVWMGEIAPAMGQDGGGIQFLSAHQVVDLVAAGYLREVTSE